MKMQIQLSNALIATSSAFAQPHTQKTSPGWTRPEVMRELLDACNACRVTKEDAAKRSPGGIFLGSFRIS